VTRTGADIGKGLLAAREAQPIPAGERIHVIGAAGAGASAAALLAQRAGAHVNGCDAGGPSPYSAALEAAGIELFWQHSAEHLGHYGQPAPQRIAVSKALTAVNPDHPELAAAAEQRIPAEPWQQLVADAAATAGQSLLAVAGTHGKSTTAGWLVHLLVTAGSDPSAFVGALLDPLLVGEPPSTARWGWGELCVVEADEYAGNFDPYQPAVAVLLNAEWDHPDVFADEAAVLDAFEGWLRRAAAGSRRPLLVANVGDPGVARIVGRLEDWPGSTVSVELDGVGASAELLAGGGSRLAVRRADGSVDRFDVGLAGRHNAENALCVIGLARALGISDDALRVSLRDYRGVGRRLELKGVVDDVVVLDDYGHHPTAIARTLEAVRHSYPGRRLWAVYEPLTYHRTAHMIDRFADVLSGADAVAIADIWAGRDRDTGLTSSAALADAVTRRGGPRAVAPGSVEQTADHLCAEVRPGDVVLVMGGGRSYVIAQRLVDLLRDRPTAADR